MKGSFVSLNPKAEIFTRIISQQPNWWILLSRDEELYIDIRKDNYFDVYYYGGLVTKIEYRKDGFKAITHQKYLGDSNPRNGKFAYDPLELSTLNKKMIADIKKHIHIDYLKHINDEYPAEKWLQGKMIISNSYFIDSEFQFNKDDEIGKLRIDLVELSGGVLTFVELKGISDNRLMHDKNRNSKTPEIIEQMRKYQLFINKYETEIIEYYKNLIEIKRSLGLVIIRNKKIILNKTPKLIIVNTYKEPKKRRNDRIFKIRDLLEYNKIDYEIIK